MILRAARLRLLGPLAHTGPTVGFGLVAAEWHTATVTNTQNRTILGLWYDGLGWLQQALPTLGDLPPPADDFAPCESRIRRSQPAWKRMIQAGLHAHAQHAAGVTLAQHVERQFFAVVKPVGVPDRIYTNERGLI
eukprot:4882090-Pyramimonas_sp.AAC.1